MMDHDSLLKKYRPLIIANLQDMVRIRSVEAPPEKDKPFGEGVHQALSLALQTAAGLGFRTVNCNGMIGYAEYGSGEEMIAILGHLDVVPEGKGWTYPPFGAEIHNGRIYGRGTTDDKGPTIAALWALKILSEENHRISRRIRIIFGTNEESGFRGINWYAANEEHPVSGFTPDITEGIVFAEKGGLHIPMRFKAGDQHAVTLASFSSGEAVNIVPDLAEAVFEGDGVTLDKWHKLLEKALLSLPCGGEIARKGNSIHIRVFGKAAHASLPEKGENAIAALSLLLAKTPPPGGSFPVFELLSRLIRDSRYGSDLGIAMSDDVSGVLTCNPGLASFSDSILTVTLDIRHPVTIQGEAVIARLQDRLAAEGVEFSVTARSTPLHVQKDSPLIAELEKAFFETTGKHAEVMAIGGGTYAKALPNVVAFSPFPNPLPELAHQVNEYIDIEDLMASILVMKNAMLRLAR